MKHFPVLQKASAKKRNNYRLIGKGQGINWPDLDEDISLEGLLDYNYELINGKKR
jgi:hypothetical protein